MSGESLSRTGRAGGGSPGLQSFTKAGDTRPGARSVQSLTGWGRQPRLLSASAYGDSGGGGFGD